MEGRRGAEGAHEEGFVFFFFFLESIIFQTRIPFYST